MSQLFVMLFLFLLSQAQPSTQITYIVVLCLGITLASATQDIVIDALRIDTLEGDELAQGTALYQVGARLGQLAAVAGMIFLSAHIAWRSAYQISIFLIVLGIFQFVSLFVKFPSQKSKNEKQKVSD